MDTSMDLTEVMPLFTTPALDSPKCLGAEMNKTPVGRFI